MYHFIQKHETLAWMQTALCMWTSVLFSVFTQTNMFIGRTGYLWFCSSSLFPSSKILLAAVKANSTEDLMLGPLNLSFMALLHWEAGLVLVTPAQQCPLWMHPCLALSCTTQCVRWQWKHNKRFRLIISMETP